MTKHTKSSAGKLGGLATVKKHGVEHMREIGRLGAAVTWQKYRLQPIGTSEFAMIDKSTGQIVAYMSGPSPQEYTP